MITGEILRLPFFYKDVSIMNEDDGGPAFSHVNQCMTLSLSSISVGSAPMSDKVSDESARCV